jgi:SpoVK/Ycf46/Vps4 family AAA+-type ATPase
MIRALVQKFTDPSGEKSAKSWGADFIENKGEGQIFLLHGSPGVGKTFVSSHMSILRSRVLTPMPQTAGKLDTMRQSRPVHVLTRPECIAEYTGRAMLSLTCGDIGTDEVEMENQLSKWFRLAEKWGAVMLIDEADVYLERRQITDLKRNSLVSGKLHDHLGLVLGCICQ